MSVTILRPHLVPLVPFYAAGVVVRNWLFDVGILRTTRISVPVISVGNLDAGGAGKTPLVEHIARRLAGQGRRVAVVSRGYGRTSQGTVVVSDGNAVLADGPASGDEPAQMAAKLKGVRVIVDEIRARGAQLAVSQLGADAIVLDDGFQHRYLRRNADIVVVPAIKAMNPDWMLPAGNRREPLRSLRRATLIAVSRCESADQLEAAKKALGQWTDKPIVGFAARVSAVRRATTRFSLDIAGLKGKAVIAFSGIGSPDAFERTVLSLGVQLKSHVRFADHHQFTASELRALEELLSAQGGDYLLTTEKDVARLTSDNDARRQFLERSPLFTVEIEQQVLEGEAILTEILRLQ